MVVTTGSEKSIVSAENKDVSAGGSGSEFIVESFNKHYIEYLNRFGTVDRLPVVEPVGQDSAESLEAELMFGADADIAGDSLVDESVDESASGEFEELPAFLQDEVEPEEEWEVEAPVFNETGSEVAPEFDEVAPEGDSGFVEEETAPAVSEELVEAEPAADEIEYEDAPAEEEAPVEDSPVVEEEAPQFIEPDWEVEQEAEVDSESLVEEEAPVSDEYYYDEEAAPAEELTSIDEDDVSYEDGVGAVEIEEEESVGYYAPEPAPAPQVIEREIVREVIVVDREQAHDLGYGGGSAASYTREAPATVKPSPAPPFHNVTRHPATPAPAETVTQPARQVEDRPLPGSYDDQPEVKISSSSQDKGLFGGLFKKKSKEKETSSVIVPQNERPEFQEPSRLRDAGAKTDYSGDSGSDSKVISVTTQEDYDPREERRRLQHVGAESRPHVDPTVWLEQTMVDALKLDASDLHIVVEGETGNLRARIRVDGQMRDFDYVTGTPARVIMGRLKAATKLSSGGSYAPEETIYEIEIDGEKRKARAVLFRVEDGGEALVMRLPLTGSLRQLDELDFSDENLQHMRELLAMPYKLIMLAGPMGSGKGSPAWERILTPNGWTTYGEITVGDTVVGSDGKATEVTGVFPRGELDVYKVSFNDGSSVTVDGDHLWSVQSPDSRHEGRGYKTIATSELAAAPLRNSKSNDAHKWFIPVVEPVQFAKQESPLPVHPYVLGALLGDGGFDGRGVNFSSVDADFAAHVNERLPEGVSLRLLDKAPSRAGKCPHYNVVGDGKVNVLLQAFRQMGLLGKKSADKFVPEQYLYASIEDRLELLRGLMDSDGHAVKSSGAEFSSVSKNLADAVVFITRSLGGVAKVTERYTGYKNNEGVRVEGQLAYRVAVKLPAEFNPFRLSRKADAWVSPTKYPVARAISSIEPAGKDEVICIQVAAENSLYVADHFIVTHNTTTAHGSLMHIADPARTVWTIEDPVERRLPNLVQLEIDEDNGAGFDVLLSKLLRADYNTLFLGEIRDPDTASAAVRQAKAGRQVMSTIHADDNIKSMMRLIELAGDSPMSVLSAVGGVVSQRLVRKLNPEWDGQDPKTKYKGRVPIHEILFVNDDIVEVMMEERPLSVIKATVKAAKGSSFYDDAVRLINAGVTDREEIVRVIGEFDAEDR